MKRIGLYFLLFLALGAVSEGVYQTTSVQTGEESALFEVKSLAEEIAQKVATPPKPDSAASAIQGLPEGTKAWVVAEPPPKKEGQLASLRRRKLLASNDGLQAGAKPPEEIEKAAADVKSRAIEGKLGAVSERIDAQTIRASAPIVQENEVVASVLILFPKETSQGSSGWLAVLLAMTVCAVLSGVLTSGAPSWVRGMKAAVGSVVFSGVLFLVHAGTVVDFWVSFGCALVAVLVSVLAGTGRLALWWAPISKARYAYGYVAPSMVGMILLVFVPFAVGMGLSFFEHEFGEWRFVGLQNFGDILFGGSRPITSPDSFYFKLLFTIFWTTSNVALHVALGLGLALLLNQPTLKYKGLYRTLLIVPWAVPSYITALIWKRMFHPDLGIINWVLGTQGLSWTDSFWKAFITNLATNVWLGVPFMMVVCLGALQSIPKDVYEAAAIDGANAWQRFWKITVPLLRPALLPSIILGMIWTFNMFNVIYLVSEGKPGGSTDILVTEAYRWAFERQERGGEYGYAAAYSTIIFFLLLLYSLGTARVTGLSKGAE